MASLQKVGGIAALFEALAYTVGFVVLATLLNPGDVESWSPAQKLEFVLQRHGLFHAWMIFIYVFFGIMLVVLSVALHERLKQDSVALMQVATALGLIWAGLVIASGMVAVVGLDAAAALHSKDAEQAASLWMTINAVQGGLGGGVEIVGGLWVLLISMVALRTGRFPKLLNYVGLVVGAAGLMTVLPQLADLGAVFGLGQIIWFAWVGVIMLRSKD